MRIARILLLIAISGLQIQCTFGQVQQLNRDNHEVNDEFIIYHKLPTDDELKNICRRIPISGKIGEKYYDGRPVFYINKNDFSQVFVSYTESSSSIYRLQNNSFLPRLVDHINIRLKRNTSLQNDPTFALTETVSSEIFFKSMQKSVNPIYESPNQNVTIEFNGKNGVNSGIRIHSKGYDDPSSIKFRIPKILQYDMSEFGIVLNKDSYLGLMENNAVEDTLQKYYLVNINTKSNNPTENFIPDYILSQLPYSFAIKNEQELNNLESLFQNSFHKYYSANLDTFDLQNIENISEYMGQYELKLRDTEIPENIMVLPKSLSILSLPDSPYLTNLENAIFDLCTEYAVNTYYPEDITNESLWINQQRPLLSDKNIKVKYFIGDEAFDAIVDAKNMKYYNFDFDEQHLRKSLEKAKNNPVTITYFYVHGLTEAHLEYDADGEPVHHTINIKIIDKRQIPDVVIERDFTWKENFLFFLTGLTTFLFANAG